MEIIDSLLSFRNPVYFGLVFIFVFMVVLIVFREPIKAIIDSIKGTVGDKFKDIEEIKNSLDILTDSEQLKDIYTVLNDFNSKLSVLNKTFDDFTNRCEMKTCNNIQETEKIKDNLDHLSQEMKDIKTELNIIKANVTNIDAHDPIFQNSVDRILQRIDAFHDILIKINTRLELISGKSINF